MDKEAVVYSAIGGVATASIAYAGYQFVSNGQPPIQTLENITNSVRETVSRGIGVVAPEYQNSQDGLPTPEQVRLWCLKVRRRSPDGIRIVRRIRTSPYFDARTDVPCDLMGFIRFASDGLGVGIPGAAILAVLLSVETWAGVSGKGTSPALYCNNFGNFKLSRAQAKATQTVPCWFLVDRYPSLDFYPAFDTPTDGVRAWKMATFGNPRYNQYGTMEALARGDIRAFCRAIGRAGYARSYAANPRTLDARAHWLMKTGRFANRSGKATIDPSVGIVWNEGI